MLKKNILFKKNKFDNVYEYDVVVVEEEEEEIISDEENQNINFESVIGIKNTSTSLLANSVLINLSNIKTFFNFIIQEDNDSEFEAFFYEYYRSKNSFNPKNF